MAASEFENAFVRYADAHIGSMLARAEIETRRFRRLQTTFHEGNYRNDIVEEPWHIGFPPGLHDSDFPTELATECVKIGLRDKVLPIPDMSDAAGKPITNPTFDQLKLWEFSELRWPIIHAFERSGFKRLTGNEIKSALSPYLKAWKARAWPCIMFSALRNLEGNFKKIQLHPGISIEHLSDRQRTYLWNRYSMDYTIPIRHFASSPFFIIAKYQQPMAAVQPSFVSDVIEDAITAMRLLQPGDIGIDGLSTAPVLPATVGGAYSPRPHLQLDFLFPGEAYRFERQNISRFHRLFKLLNSLPAVRKKEFLIALSRFNRTYSRRLDGDGIIDMAICLEVLLLRGLNDELSYRFSIRGAKLLSEVNSEQDTYATLHQFYQIRSQVVHGEHFPTSRMENRISQRFPGLNSRTFMVKVGSLVRQIIIQMLLKASLGSSIQSICDDLDTAALT